MLGGRLGINASVIFRRKGVDETAQTFHFFRDIPARSFGGPFEKEMLQKMGDPAKFLRLMPAAYRDPDAHADTFHFRHLTRSDPDAVFQTRCPVLHSTFRPG